MSVLPAWKVDLAGGFGALSVTLAPASLGVVVKADTSLVLDGGVTSAMHTNFSSWISGGSLFMVKLSGAGVARAFPFMPGSVQVIDLRPGVDYYVTHGAFLAASENVVIAPSVQLGGVLLNQSVIYMRVSVPPGAAGFVAVAGYGTLVEQTVPAAGLLVEGGLLVAFPAACAFDTTRGNASLGATILSDMGFYTRFLTAGAKVLTQAGSVNRMARFMAAKEGVPDRPPTVAGEVGAVAATGLLAAMFGSSSGGAKKPAKPRKKKPQPRA